MVDASIRWLPWTEIVLTTAASAVDAPRRPPTPEKIGAVNATKNATAAAHAIFLNEFIGFEYLIEISRRPVAWLTDSPQAPFNTEIYSLFSTMQAPRLSHLPNLAARCSLVTHPSHFSELTQTNNTVPGCENH
jgi:hypothetical protein